MHSMRENAGCAPVRLAGVEPLQALPVAAAFATLLLPRS